MAKAFPEESQGDSLAVGFAHLKELGQQLADRSTRKSLAFVLT